MSKTSKSPFADTKVARNPKSNRIQASQKIEKGEQLRLLRSEEQALFEYKIESVSGINKGTRKNKKEISKSSIRKAKRKRAASHEVFRQHIVQGQTDHKNGRYSQAMTCFLRALILSEGEVNHNRYSFWRSYIFGMLGQMLWTIW